MATRSRGLAQTSWAQNPAWQTLQDARFATEDDATGSTGASSTGQATGALRVESQFGSCVRLGVRCACAVSCRRTSARVRNKTAMTLNQVNTCLVNHMSMGGHPHPLMADLRPASKIDAATKFADVHHSATPRQTVAPMLTASKQDVE